MQVSTSNSGRSAGVANRTPLVATTGTRNAAARSTSVAVVGLFVARQMPLQLDVHAVAAEQADEPIEQAADAVAGAPSSAARPASATSPPVAAVELVERQRAFAFRRAQLHARDQPAEVAVALLRFRRGRADAKAERLRAGKSGTMF